MTKWQPIPKFTPNPPVNGSCPVLGGAVPFLTPGFAGEYEPADDAGLILNCVAIAAKAGV